MSESEIDPADEELIEGEIDPADDGWDEPDDTDLAGPLGLGQSAFTHP